MPIDSSLYGQFAPQAQSSIDYAQKYNVLDQQRMGLQTNRLNLQQAQALADQKAGLRNDLQNGSLDPSNPQHQAMIAAKYPDIGAAFLNTLQTGQTSRAAAAKDLAQAGHYGAQTSQINAQTLRDDYASTAKFVLANPTADNARRAVIQMAAKYGGDPTQELMQLQQIGDNADGLKQWASGHSLTAEQMLPKTGMQDTGGSIQPTAQNPITGQVTNVGAPLAKSQTPDSIASNETQRRGQNMTAGTAAATLAQAGQKLEYRDDGNGNIVAVPAIGKPGQVIKAQSVTAPGPGMVPLQGGKDLNDSQAKSYLFGSRMQAADALLSRLAAGGTTRGGNINAMAGSIPLVGSAADTLTNFTQSPEQQQVKQAKLDFMTAALRRESGASIAPSEFDTFDKAYFPQVNDDKMTIANKAALRKRAIDGTLIEVPQNKRPKADAQIKPGSTIKFDTQGNMVP